MRRSPAAVDMHGRPQFAAMLSHIAGEQEKVADIHPAFRRRKRFGPDGMRWLAPQQRCELTARYPRQVRPAPVLPVLPSTIDCQSNLCRESVLFSGIRWNAGTTRSAPARAQARRPCPRTATPTPAARSCWLPPRCGVGESRACQAMFRRDQPVSSPAEPALCRHG